MPLNKYTKSYKPLVIRRPIPPLIKYHKLIPPFSEIFWLNVLVIELPIWVNKFPTALNIVPINGNNAFNTAHTPLNKSIRPLNNGWSGLNFSFIPDTAASVSEDDNERIPSTILPNP